MKDFLKAIGLKLDQPVIIKPNWVAPIKGEYTEAKPLELLFSAISGKKYLIESYSFWRTDLYLKEEKDYFSSSEGTLEGGKQHWDHFKKMDQWFLDYMKISPLLKKYDVKYINITNEYWKGECVDPEIVRNEVEKKYSPVNRKEFYSFLPKVLHDMKGRQLLSFSHAKAYVNWQATLSIKNFFGLIPSPTRYPLYHGDGNDDVPRNVVDINKIYRTFFDCFFSVEGITNVLTEYDEGNKHKIVPDWGYILGGKNSVEVDNIAAKLIGKNLDEAMLNPIKEAEEIFGGYDKSVFAKLPKEIFVKQ